MWNHTIEAGSELNSAADAPTWTQAETDQPSGPLDWRTVDRALRAIRRSRAALDAEEMHWLREAEALQIWRPLGMVSALDYLERTLGYRPRTAQDRLRVARALGSLPQLTAALAGDELTFSAVRELTRVATPATETAWLAAAAGKNVRQIEELVADHRPGDHPDDPPDPTARTHLVQFELDAETFALLRQARQVLDSEHGTGLDDNAFIAGLCSAVLDGSSTTEPTGRARFQIAITLCSRCRQGWQEGAGAQIAIDPAAVDRALCDAQHIGSLDDTAPERAQQDIPPSTVRLVWRRDGGRCRVPGCRSSRGLEIHHIIHRADGGTHDPSNLALLCSSCHLAHHRGALTITGTADRLEVARPNQVAAHRRTDHPAARLRDAAAAAGNPTIAPAGAHVGAAIRSVGVRSMGATIDAENKPSLRTDAHADAPNELPVAASGGAHTAAAKLPAIAIAEDVGSSSRLDFAILKTEAKAALTTLGWKPAVAGNAVTVAADALGNDISLEQLIRESLRRCPCNRTKPAL